MEPMGPDQERSPSVLLAAPDAFKGTASASDIATAICRGARSAGWGCDPCAMSDGGEGFAEVLSAGRPGAGRWYECDVTGPLGDRVTAPWWLGDDVGAGPEAIIECAAASGLPLAGGAAGNDPLGATTRGTGELIVAAVRAGARRVLLGVGGSATTDGGRGALDAIAEAGGLHGAELVVACDVDTLFVDAAERFAPQKGADPAQVLDLHHRLVILAASYLDGYGVDVLSLPGAGAAGGLAGGLAAVGARLVSGIEVVAEAVGLGERLSGVDLVVTGEGRLDSTSWSGKVVGGVVRAAATAGVPVVIVSGSAEDGSTAAGGPSVLVVDLSARFGRSRALADPTGCVAEAVATAMAMAMALPPGVPPGV
jgi:glycerate 2-kinase